MLDTHAERVRFVRSLTNLSREEFEKKYGISRNTVKSWELSINSLTERSATQLSDAIKQEGFSCSPEWLIFGTGSPPKLLNSMEESFLDGLNEQSKMVYEADFFKKNYHNAIVTMITDQSMSPIYQLGDYVGGIKFETLTNLEQIKKFIGSICIVISSKGISLIRKIFLGNPDYVLLCPVNLEFQADVVKLEDIATVAKIIWHRTMDNNE